MILQRIHIANRSIDAVFLDKDITETNLKSLIETIRNKFNLQSIVLLGDIASANKYNDISNNYMAKPVMIRRLSSVLDQLFNATASDLKQEHIHSIESPPNDKQTFENYAILLAEDNVFNRHVAIEILKQAGFTQVDIAENGKKVIEALKKKTYHLILMDIQMPEMDGLQASQYIRNQFEWINIPIIAMTANALKGDQEECIKAGMNDYVSKPIDRKIFVNKVKKWIIQGD